MVDVFFTKLNDLLVKCDLADDEKEFLEQLAEFMVFPDRDTNKDPRKLLSRSIQKAEKSKVVLDEPVGKDAIGRALKKTKLDLTKTNTGASRRKKTPNS